MFPEIPADFASLTDDELQLFVDASVEAINAVNDAPQDSVSADFTAADLISAVEAQVEAVDAARAEQTTRAAAAEAVVVDDDSAARLSELATRARAETDPEDDEPEGDEPADEPEAEAAIVAPAVEAPAVTAAADPAPEPPRAPLPRPARSTESAPQETQPAATLTASAGGLGFEIGAEIPTGAELADMMIRRRKDFGRIAKGTKGEKIPIAQLDWRDIYSADRILSDGDGVGNMSKIESVIDPDRIREAFNLRRESAITASGGLCAPVTPYYQLAMISVAERPVRAALPSFNADRGGVRYARPAALSAITTGVGIKTAAEDGAGGTEALKTCQVVACPDFQETDVDIIYHCLQFGNLGARTFPERVTQWNNLVLASHARLAESTLLTNIDAFSTQVTAATLGLGIIGDLLGQIEAAGAGLRSRNRMSEDAVLRIMLPRWVLNAFVSDVLRSQFGRFDMTEAQFIALIRAMNIEPTFYIDGAAGKSQVFGTQNAGALLPFPAHVTWYLYPEGSFLYLDGGTLELGLVRDSVLNSTNDFQIFGETFENVAFVGVEALAVTSAVCDSGTVALPHAVTCPIAYS